MDHQVQQNNRGRTNKKRGHRRGNIPNVRTPSTLSTGTVEKTQIQLLSNLKCYYANIDNSIMSKYEDLSVEISKNNYDLLALTEIKPKFGDVPTLQSMKIDGYDLITSDLTHNFTRGACIYVKSKYMASRVTPRTQETFVDSVWIEIRTPHQNSLLVGCIYRSGTPATAHPRDSALNEMLIWAANNTHSHKLIMGDFNYPAITWSPAPLNLNSQSNNNPENIFIECIRDSFLHQSITQPTRFRPNQTPTLDDLIFSNEPEMVEQLEYLNPLGASDHIGLSFHFNFGVESQTPIKSILQYDKADYNEMRRMLHIDWERELEGLCTQDAFDALTHRITEAVEKYVPIKRINPDKHRTKPIWMNWNALHKSRKKYHAWIRYLNTKDNEDWKTYTRARNIATHASKEARKDYEKRVAAESKSNNKAFWKYVNSRRKTRVKIPDLRKQNGILITTDVEKAEELNLAYHKAFTTEDTKNLPIFEQKTLITEHLSSLHISENNVKIMLDKLRVDKSPGPDQLHPRVLKEVSEEIAKPLSLIFNSSISNREVPRQWREGNITPIYKKGNKAVPANYRPISLTSVVCKILERIICEKIIDHLQQNNLECTQQHGFTKGKSTVTNLLEALNIWLEAQSHGVPVDVMFLDYAKAFDTVPHLRLLKKLEANGIRGDLLEWIKIFLTQRRQRVVVNQVTSGWRPVTSGVPQGSVLGPLLFAIFVSDIPNQLKNFVSLFADDTKICSTSLNCAEVHTDCLQADLNSLQEWTDTMQMKFHPTKCKVLHLGRNNPQHPYFMRNTDGSMHNIEKTTAEKDLGVVIDQKLSFTDHIQAQVNTANKTLGAIRHTFKNMDKETFLCLYKSLVRPHLEYASVIWSPKTKRDKDAIERVQRRATRLVPCITHLPYPARLKELRLPTLLYRRLRTDTLQLYKITHGIDKVNTESPCAICNKQMLEPSLATTTRGHQYKYQVQHSSGAKSSFFSSRIVSTWNSLSEETVSSPTINCFKGRLAREWNNHPDLYNYVFSY